LGEKRGREGERERKRERGGRENTEKEGVREREKQNERGNGRKRKRGNEAAEAGGDNLSVVKISFSPHKLCHTMTAANPWYTIRSLDPGTMGWHRVYRRRQRVPRHDLNPSPSATPPSTSYVSEEEESGGPEGGDEGMFEYVDDESLSYLQAVWEERKRGALASLGGRRGAEANPSLLIGPFMVLLITSSPFDPFSNQLEARVTQVAPAFPHVLFLKGEGKDFSGLVAQISVKGLPQVLLFEENLLRGRFRGVKTVRNLLSFLVLHTGCLPRAVVTGNGEPEDKLMVRLPMVDEPGLGWIYALSVIWVLGEWVLKLAKMGRKERRATNSDEGDEKQE
jgi:hypothetical protein